MKGVENLRHPIPKYSFVWDVEQELKYLRSFHPLQMLDKKILSLNRQ